MHNFCLTLIRNTNHNIFFTFFNFSYMFLNPNTYFFSIWILLVLIHYIWETFRNKLEKYSFTENCSDLSPLFEQIVLVHCNPVQGQYRASTYRASTGPEQGFPCVLFPHREKPVYISWDPCNENRFFPVGKSTQGKPCFHYRDGFAV